MLPGHFLGKFFPLAWYCLSLIYNWSGLLCWNACVCVTLSAVTCVRGASFLTRFLCCQSILCEWLPVIASLELCLLPNLATVAFPFSSVSHQVFLLPHSFLTSFLSPQVSFSSSLWVCVLPERWYEGLEVGGFLWSVYLLFQFIFPKGVQPQNNQRTSSWNSCQAWVHLPFVRCVSNPTIVKRLLMMTCLLAVGLNVGCTYYHLRK